MNKTYITIAAIISTAAVIIFALYFHNTRYSSHKTSTYGISRYSSLPTAEEEKVIRIVNMVKNSHAWGGYYTVGDQIKSYLEEKTGLLTVYGWKVKASDEHIYLLSYTFDEGNGIDGWYFEVNLVADIVRNVTGDPDLERKYMIDSLP